MDEGRMVRVIGSRLLRIPDGFISWEEHVKVWELYHKKWSSSQSAERIAERGGFYMDEVVELLGQQPMTWRAR
jgi:hypothetical protein